MPRERRDGKLLAIKRDLLAKGAADIRASNCDLRFGKPHATGQLGLERMWHLIANMHGQMTPALFPDGATATRLYRCMCLAMLMKRSLNDEIGLGEAASGIADGEALPRDKIAGQALVDQGSVNGERTIKVGNWIEHIVVDSHEFCGVFCQITVGSDDANDGIADEANLIDWERGKLNRLQSLNRRRHTHRGGPFVKLPPSDDRNDALRFECRCGIDGGNPGMGMRRPDKMRMQATGDDNIVEITALPGDEPVVFL